MACSLARRRLQHKGDDMTNRILIGIDGAQSKRALRKELKRARRLGAPVTFVAVCSATLPIRDASAALEPSMAEAKKLGVDALKLLILTGRVEEPVGRGDDGELARSA